ncbi:MAG: class I SAM-dependent methyltransferase [Alphaproteobacteria bacterium]
MSDAQEHQTRILSQFTRWARPFAELPAHAQPEAMRQSLDAAQIGPDDVVLDVACGPGLVACEAAPRARHVTGVDLTPAMIEQAKRRQAELGLTNLSWDVADAYVLPFDDASFDVVITRYSFHHLLEPGRSLLEMRRVCRPGGRIAVIDCTPAAEAQDAYNRMERVRDPSHTAALTPGELRALGQQAALEEFAVDGYRLPVLLDSLADAETLPELLSIFEADIAGGEDRLGVGAYRAADGIHFFFPVSIMVWRKPA